MPGHVGGDGAGVGGALIGDSDLIHARIGGAGLSCAGFSSAGHSSASFRSAGFGGPLPGSSQSELAHSIGADEGGDVVDGGVLVQ